MSSYPTPRAKYNDGDWAKKMGSGENAQQNGGCRPIGRRCHTPDDEIFRLVGALTHNRRFLRNRATESGDLRN